LQFRTRAKAPSQKASLPMLQFCARAKLLSQKAVGFLTMIQG
jgi:hypothetical protein